MASGRLVKVDDTHTVDLDHVALIQKDHVGAETDDTWLVRLITATGYKLYDGPTVTGAVADSVIAELTGPQEV